MSSAENETAPTGRGCSTFRVFEFYCFGLVAAEGFVDVFLLLALDFTLVDLLGPVIGPIVALVVGPIVALVVGPIVALVIGPMVALVIGPMVALVVGPIVAPVIGPIVVCGWARPCVCPGILCPAFVGIDVAGRDPPVPGA